MTTSVVNRTIKKVSLSKKPKPLNGYKFSRLGRKLATWLRAKKFTRSEEVKACLEFVVAHSVIGGVDSDKVLEMMAALETRMGGDSAGVQGPTL